MGALVAVLARHGQAPSAIARRMLAAAPHRGEQHELIELASCALGVQDTAEGGDVGIALGDGIAVAFAGVIDNIESLRGELRGGDGLTTAAAVVHAVVVGHRERSAERLRGVFVVAFTDGRRLWCIRDQIGFRSLYYRRDSNAVYAASEPKQVVAGAGIAREPALDVVERIYYRDTRGTLPSTLRGVERLGQASLLESDGDRLRVDRYWNPESLLETARLNDAEIQERFDELMTQAATRAVTGRDIVLLSGGVDSPAIASYAVEPHRQLSDQPLKALSTIYPHDPSVDERRYVEEVAAALGLELHLVEHNANPLDDMRDWTRLADGPIPVASMALYADSYRRAHELGARTVLTGELAEFLVAFNDYLLPFLAARGRLSPLAERLRAGRREGASLRALAAEVLAPIIPAGISRARARRQRDGIPAWLDARALNDPFAASVGWIGRRWALLQLYGLDGTSASMEAEEICQQVCGVQVRRPWADIDLWEFFLSLRAEAKFPPGSRKELVRQLLRGRVPDVILDRRDKTYFDASLVRTLDYPELQRWLAKREHRMPGVDYELLDQRVERRELSAIEFVWAKDLASVNAFLSEWHE